MHKVGATGGTVPEEISIIKKKSQTLNWDKKYALRVCQELARPYLFQAQGYKSGKLFP